MSEKFFNEVEGLGDVKKRIELSSDRENVREERVANLEGNAKRFVDTCVEHAEELSSEQIALVSEYLRTHSGTWQSYDDESVYVSTAEIVGNEWVVDFAVQGDDEDDEWCTVTERIPLS